MNNNSRALIKFAVAFTLLLIAYIPTFQWMTDRWFAPESYYGHGFLIPIISLYIVWQRREVLKKVRMASSGIGLWMVVSGLLIHIVSTSLQVAFISGFSFVLVLCGLILFLLGKEMMRSLVFPVLFLLAMVPLPLVLIGNITVKLKLFAANVSTFVLNKIGFRCILDGSTIRMPSSYMEVAAPCSGLRSLISLLTLGLLFAYAMKISLAKKVMLFLSSVPIALASNVARIVMLGVVNDLYGEKIAMGFFHDFTGFLVFAFAFGGLFGISRILEGNVEKKYE